MPETFTCDHCGRTFPYSDDWTDEDALTEERQNFGTAASESPQDRALICDDCYQQMIAWWREEGGHSAT